MLDNNWAGYKNIGFRFQKHIYDVDNKFGISLMVLI